MFISLSHGSGEAYSGKIWGKKYWNPINKFGFRDEEPKKRKNSVFFVGDSFTAGWGVKNIQDRFGETTANELAKKGKKINEINLGRYGADTKLEFHLFEKFIYNTGIKPDQIILQFFVNDMDKFIPKNKKCISNTENIPRWKKMVIEGSYLANYINSLYPSNNSNFKPLKECEYSEQLKHVYSSDSLWKKEELQLNKFLNYSTKNKIPLMIVFFPFMEDLKLAKKLNIEKRINKYCIDNNIKLLNVTNYIQKIPKVKRQVSIMDSHASDIIHKITGKQLAEILKNEF
jgi:hypothetical protein